MRAVFRNRALIQAKDRDVAQAIDDLVGAVNTAPVFIGDARITSGSGTPEAKVVGSVGDLYLRLDGSTSTTLYVKTSGANSASGWTAK